MPSASSEKIEMHYKVEKRIVLPCVGEGRRVADILQHRDEVEKSKRTKRKDLSLEGLLKLRRGLNL